MPFFLQGVSTLTITEHALDVLRLRTRYLVAGSGPALVLLHGVGENAADWRWVMPMLARTHRVYALDLPSVGPWRGPEAEYGPHFVAHFVASFLDTIGIERAALAGNSLGGHAAIHVAAAAPARVTALVLVDSAGLGRAISPALVALTPWGVGEAAITLSKTPLGALQRAWGRTPLLFAHPTRVPRLWITEQVCLAQQQDFLPTALASLQAQVNLQGQREVVLDQLPKLQLPTLVVWGERDRVVPVVQAAKAVEQLPEAQLVVIPDCGHLPQVECPVEVATAFNQFLASHVFG
jgi:4,5:9,10-diseco-3-hydroxy-5,9,17-trioxoandrosta-1(10),2-diene-4-oate hydrolase